MGMKIERNTHATPIIEHFIVCRARHSYTHTHCTDGRIKKNEENKKRVIKSKSKTHEGQRSRVQLIKRK